MHATLSPPWKKSLLLVFVSVVAFVTATPATSGPQCFFQGLGFLPGANFSIANGVSADGTVVVGDARDASGIPQAFRWTAASGMVALRSHGDPSGTRSLSFAAGVNADGTVVVGTDEFRGLPPQAFRWTAATGRVGLGFLPRGSEANGVNADGTVVVGESRGASGGLQAFRWTAATGMVGLGFLPGDKQSAARGVNADGTVVVGSSSDPSGRNQAFRWVNGTMTGLDFLPGGNQSSARGVNADGKVVVGAAIDASGANQAFRWTAETRVQSVITLLLAAKVVTMAGWQLRSANGVSADGTVIVGDGVDPLGQSQAWIARLPPEDNEDCNEDENEDELEGRDQRD